MNSVGTYKWSFDRNGLLTGGDRFMLYRQMLNLQLQTIAERLAKMGIWGRPPLDADVSTIPIPDSAMAREAEEYAAQMYGSTLNSLFENLFLGGFNWQSRWFQARFRTFVCSEHFTRLRLKRNLFTQSSFLLFCGNRGKIGAKFYPQ